jgi:hypothetical protein
LGGPSPAFAVVDGQCGGGTPPPEAAAADLHMGCLYVMRWRRLSAPLSTSSPHIHFSKFARDARANSGIEGDPAQRHLPRRLSLLPFLFVLAIRTPKPALPSSSMKRTPALSNTVWMRESVEI